MSSEKVEAALAAVFAETSGCWVARLEEEPATFMRLLREKEDAGVKVPRKAAVAALKTHWGVERSDEVVRLHLTRQCKCQ